MNHWVLHVHTGKEMAVAEALKAFNIKVPTKSMYRRKNGVWRLETHLLTPGYVFGAFEKTPENYYTVRQNPHVIRILGELLGGDAEKAQWLINGGEAVAPSRLTIRNGNLVVAEGFLAGREKAITAIHRRQRKVTLELDFLGKKRSLSVPVDFI